jgi:hypothetical protein
MGELVVLVEMVELQELQLPVEPVEPLAQQVPVVFSMLEDLLVLITAPFRRIHILR